MNRQQQRRPRNEPTTVKGFPVRILLTGALALAAAAASWWMIGSSPAIHCDDLAPLAVLATLAAFIISVCFRQMSRYPGRGSRWFLFACLLLAGATLFTDFRFVRRYRSFCHELRQQVRQQTRGH